MRWTLALVGLSIFFVGNALANEKDASWPQWRGPAASGSADTAKPPLEWSPEKNMAWKVAIPGKGSSTPIIWGDKIILTTAIDTGEEPKDGEKAAIDGGGRATIEQVVAFQDEERPRRRFNQDGPGGFRRGGRGGFGGGRAPTTVQQFMVMAINRNTGEVLWKTQVHEQVPIAGHHNDGNYAAGSPVTDGENIYAWFGSYGIYCLDMDGKIKWGKDIVDMQTRGSFGEGSSPALYGDKLVVVCDHEGDSFIVAFDKNDGRELWRKARGERTSWFTPIIVEVNGKPQVITTGADSTIAYDLAGGEQVWTGPGLTTNPIPSPIVKDGVAYLTSGFRGAALIAVDLAKAKGDISKDNGILWEYNTDTPYVPSPVLYDGNLYFGKGNSAILTCLDAKTGKQHYMERIEGLRDMYASPVAAAGRIYTTGRDGSTVVIKAGEKMEVLATNSVGEATDASPAIVGDTIYIRGNEHLFCIKE